MPAERDAKVSSIFALGLARAIASIPGGGSDSSSRADIRMRMSQR
jgi:hypothetical protein